MGATSDAAVPEHRAALYRELRAVESAPFWEVVDRSSAPRPATVPHRWRWTELRPLLRRAGELVTTEEAERRVLMLVNPATRGDKRAVGNLYAGLQLVMPGESARAHRHTACALRFVLEGAGASTIVDGAALRVERFDLVLTPGWAWHDHVNTTDEPVVWLDALDSPLTRALDAWFFEPHPDGFQTPMAEDADDRSTAAVLPLRYRWEDTSAALDAAMASAGGTTAVVDYTQPATGDDVFPTIRCRAVRIATGGTFGPLRRVGGAVYCVVDGKGTVRVGPAHYDVEFGDVFCVPSWYPLEIGNADGAALSLFAYDDEPVLRALGLARSEHVRAH